ncbi:MAG: YidC/Oxa1 family membrane protein insertase [Anaerolineae bacterium]
MDFSIVGTIFNALVVQPSIAILQFFYGILGSYGWALILIGVLVRLVTWPLQMQSLKQQKLMSSLQPQLEELKKKYKDDKEKLTQAQMQLYKENNVNMLGGCLPMLLPFPVLIGLYQAIQQLSHTAEFAVAFLWLHNLALPEARLPLPFFSQDPNVPIGIPILLIIMVASQFVQQQMMTMPNQDPSQRQMSSIMKWMPLYFAFIFINVAVGLVLYWVAQNVTGIILQYCTVGPGGLKVPPPPWLKQDNPPIKTLSTPTAAVAVTEASVSSSPPTDASIVSDGDTENAPKRRANDRKKKRRSSR